MSIPPKLRNSIAKRDNNQCKYCLTSEENCGLRMHVDHVIPESEGGSMTLDNLCLVCFSCNVYKGAKQTWIDPQSKELIHLFHPLLQSWNDHFCWDESKTKIIGLTPCGRATVEALKMNNSTIVNARRRWVSAGWHPPKL